MCQGNYDCFNLIDNGSNRYQRALCLILSDVDECRLGSHNCSKNATCINASTGCECVCNEGFTGDGLSCTGKITCKVKSTMVTMM